MNNNILSFLRRYWLLIASLILFGALCLSETLFGYIGTLIYGPVLFFGAVVTALLARHFFFRQSLDEDAHSGTFVDFWVKNLSATDRVKLNLMVVCVFVLAAAIIFAALIK